MQGFKYDKDGAWIEKDPNAKKDYAIDFAVPGDSWLIDGDTLESVTWSYPSGITYLSSSFSPTKATVWFGGGTDGISYTITCHIVTTQGREDDKSFRIVVKSQ